jgi:hypothetical protein
MNVLSRDSQRRLLRVVLAGGSMRLSHKLVDCDKDTAHRLLRKLDAVARWQFGAVSGRTPADRLREHVRRGHSFDLLWSWMPSLEDSRLVAQSSRRKTYYREVGAWTVPRD